MVAHILFIQPTNYSVDQLQLGKTDSQAILPRVGPEMMSLPSTNRGWSGIAGTLVIAWFTGTVALHHVSDSDVLAAPGNCGDIHRGITSPASKSCQQVNPDRASPVPGHGNPTERD